MLLKVLDCRFARGLKFSALLIGEMTNSARRDTGEPRKNGVNPHKNTLPSDSYQYNLLSSWILKDRAAL